MLLACQRLKNKKKKPKKKGDEAKAAKQKEMERVAEIDSQIAALQKEISECEKQIMLGLKWKCRHAECTFI